VRLAQPGRETAGLDALVRTQRSGLTRTPPTISPDDIVRSPAWLPLEAVDGPAMRLVYLDEAAYRAASFLDQRLLGIGYEQQVCGLAVVEAAAARLAPRSHYIFHTGHVGSTLLSRLIGAHEGLFSVREPALLRSLGAPAGSALQLDAALALLGRTWRPNQRAVVKTTSFVSELADPILAADPGSVAIFVFARPLVYLRGILAGPNSRVENRHLAPSRLQRLTRRLGEGELSPRPHSEGECVAMSWLCEMTALHQAAVSFEGRVLWVDFDTFLGNPAPGLQAMFRALGASPSEGEVEALVAGPLMRQYSKAPEYAYDAELRRRVLQSADTEHGAEIKRGMNWLKEIAMHHRLVEAVRERVAPEGA